MPAGGGPRRIPRRAFLIDAAVGVACALSLGALATRFLAFLTPPPRPERDVEFAATPLAEVPDGGGSVVSLPSGAVAIERAGDRVRAFSATCTHLGCIVTWQPQAGSVWLCPCHRGRYDRDGRVVAGPPPRALQPLPAEVRDGKVYVKVRLRAPDVRT
jgi:cytochrome b6-f complex iron-sulfur subunit